MATSKPEKVRRLVQEREPPVLTIIGLEANKNGTDKLTLREIDQVIKEVRKQRKLKR
jgi:hypothetical protein